MAADHPERAQGGIEEVRGKGAERWIERGREGGRLPRRPEEGTTATNKGTKRAAGNQDSMENSREKKKEKEKEGEKYHQGKN